MLREEVLNSSKELVNQIYEKMNIIETCDATAEKVKELDVCFNDIDNKQIVALEGILTTEQLNAIRAGIIDNIYNNAAIAQSFLEKLNRKPATINPLFEQAVKEMESQSKPPRNKKIEFDLVEMKELYINKKMSLRDISEHFGCAASTVHSFVKNHNLSREVKEEKPTYPVMTVEAVRQVYTNGTMSLADAAKHFGVGSNDLHNFIEKHGLKRQVVKTNDPFRDKNKMSQEEFKRKMLSSRK